MDEKTIKSSWNVYLCLCPKIENYLSWKQSVGRLDQMCVSSAFTLPLPVSICIPLKAKTFCFCFTRLFLFDAKLSKNHSFKCFYFSFVCSKFISSCILLLSKWMSCFETKSLNHVFIISKVSKWISQWLEFYNKPSPHALYVLMTSLMGCLHMGHSPALDHWLTAHWKHMHMWPQE